MKTQKKLLVLAMAGSLALGTTFTARANLEISATVQIHAVADFDAPLAAEGAWVTVGSYGRCWHPRAVAVDWRPYCDGEWVWTDNGWYWQSDESWAWACYHYGSWTLEPSVGWVWIPDVEWAPAWVVWRNGGGYTGWAPCAPHGVTVSADWFAFVPTVHMAERVRPATLVFKNQEIIRKTTVLKPASRETRNVGGRSVSVVVNKGPGVTDFQKAAGHEVKPVAIQEAHGRTHFPDTVVHRTPAVRPAPAINNGQQHAPGQERAPVHVEPPHERPVDQPRPAEPPRGKEERHDP